MVWPGVGMNWIGSLKAKSLFTICGAFGRDDRQHGVGDPRHARRIVLLPLRPVRELAVGHDVFRLGKGRHPAAVLEPGVPADMIAVQMRAHHIVDVVDSEARSAKPLLEAVAVHHVPERPRRPRLVIADAGIDQDVVVRRLDHEALDAEHQIAIRRIDEFRLQPGRGFRRAFPWSASGKKSFSVEEGALLLDNRVNGDVVERDRHCHGAPRIGLMTI